MKEPSALVVTSQRGAWEPRRAHHSCKVHISMSEGPSGVGDLNVSRFESLGELFERGLALQESSPAEAIEILEKVQLQVARLSLFSRNEDLSEVSTKSIPFLALEHHLAACYMNRPTGPRQLDNRLATLKQACALWTAFLQHLEQLRLINKGEKATFNDLIEVQSSLSSLESGQMATLSPALPSNRDEKISRFKAKQTLQNETQHLESLMQRRNRLDLVENEDLDGYDAESLLRALHLKNLEIYKAEALEELYGATRELPMLIMMISRQQPDDGMRHLVEDDRSASVPSNSRPLQVTRITHNASGQLQARQEEIRSQVFRPHWQQPTMSLEELAEREVAAAIDRERRQIAAEQDEERSRRYNQLTKDGLEDNDGLVERSALLDQQWDDWKDANPRGSGNKRGDVGDRNF